MTPPSTCQCTHHAFGTIQLASLGPLFPVSTVEELPAITQQTVVPEDLAATVPEHAPSFTEKTKLSLLEMKHLVAGKTRSYLDVVKTFAVRSKDKLVDVVRTVKASITRDV